MLTTPSRTGAARTAATDVDVAVLAGQGPPVPPDVWCGDAADALRGPRTRTGGVSG